MKHITIAIIAISLLATPWILQNSPEFVAHIDNAYQYVEENLATVFLVHKPVTINDLQNRYNAPPKNQIKVLIVPGHEPNYGGTEYRDLKEREFNTTLANYLSGFLKSNGRYEVVITRNNNEWSPIFSDYFKNNWDEIVTFFKISKEETLSFVNVKKTNSLVTKSLHNKAPVNVAYRLYGINKWGNDNSVDIAVHIHFNDYPRKDTSKPGKYSGFAIYVPQNTYLNSTTTRAVANSVYKRLSKYNPISNFPPEDSGVVESLDLIAIGAYNTSDVASMLIEYGYIYEPQFTSKDVRESTLKDLAFQTYLGIQDFFGSGNDFTLAYDTLLLPYSWDKTFGSKSTNTDAILALQSALIEDGSFPPPGKDINDCPRDGVLGLCTQTAVSTFQTRYGIKNEKGIIGEKTKSLLNTKYSIGSGN